MEKVTKIFDYVYLFFMTICKLFFIGMVVVTAYVVFGRFVLNNSPSWGEELALLCMVYMSMISAALAIRKDTHIRMTIIDLFLPEKVVGFFKGLAQVAIFGFSWFMIIYGWQFAQLMGRSMMTGLRIKSMYLYLAIPIAGVALCLMEIERLINFFYRRKGGTVNE
ncbi:MAG: TRAP transporter small permease [Lachnospiraceae bacterium]|nr:TRAP transporter small permease [Lachnospiraceae bacterium]MCI8995324.1 TRAP transporter small permease [Lachnospiraceae bacterium]MCI9133939.1 TRAP transporter small permease [Lachnospiraceae bacterium]